MAPKKKSDHVLVIQACWQERAEIVAVYSADDAVGAFTLFADLNENGHPAHAHAEFTIAMFPLGKEV